MRPPSTTIFTLSVLTLGCGPSLDGNEGGQTMESGEGTCVPKEPAAEVVVESEGTNPDDCIVSMVEQDAADPRHWRTELQCSDGLFSTDLLLDPPLEVFPLGVGEPVTAFVALGPEGHYVEFLVDNQIRLVSADIRTPGEGTPVDEPLFPVGLVHFDWSDMSGCVALDAQCGTVELRSVEAYLDTVINPQVIMVDPQLPYGELVDPDQKLGVWLGHNWVSECGGQTTSQAHYVVALLP